MAYELAGAIFIHVRTIENRLKNPAQPDLESINFQAEK
jgi:hypothetical protein